MRKNIAFILLMVLSFCFTNTSTACSVLYYVDQNTGKIYVVNNEDYWYDVNAYIQFVPNRSDEFARLWYGWDNFAQGGVNEKGLFFDAAVTPEQPEISGFGFPKGNLGDDILANCQNVKEALKYLEDNKIAVYDSHLMFGDSSGQAVIVEWVNGKRELHWIKNNHLTMTNFLLSKPEAGNYPCYRYQSIEKNILALEDSGVEINLNRIGNTMGQAVQVPQKNEEGREGGTLYTSFINLTDMEFVLSYKLSNQNLIKLDLKEEFSNSRKKKIKL